MKCPKCETETIHNSTGETLVGYPIFNDELGKHNHNDNCLKRYYHCKNCGHNWIESIIRTCTNKKCDWKGVNKCFCHKEPKVEKWTDK